MYKKLTVKEEAKRIFDLMYNVKDADGFHSMSVHRAKVCAILLVDNLIQEHTFDFPLKWNTDRKNHWVKVKLELGTF